MTIKQSAGARSRISLGARIKALRLRRRWTLTEVSRRSGLSVSSLSKAERGRMDFTVDKFLRLSAVLEADIAQLLAPESALTKRRESGGRRSVTRTDQGKVIETASAHYRYLATDLLDRKSVPMVIEVTAHSLAEFGEFNRHPGEEFLFVLNGQLDLYTSAYLPVRMKAGDSMYFDSNMGHAYVAVGNGSCRILSVCIAPRVAEILRLGENDPLGEHGNSRAQADSARSGAHRHQL